MKEHVQIKGQTTWSKEKVLNKTQYPFQDKNPHLDQEKGKDPKEVLADDLILYIENPIGHIHINY